MKGEKGGERVPVPVAGPAFRGGVYFVLFKLFGCVLEFAFEVVSIESTFSPVCNAGLEGKNRGKPVRWAASGPRGDGTRGSGGSLPAWDAGGQEEDTPPLCQATLSPRRGREDPAWRGATRLTQHRRSDGRLHPIRSGTQGRSEGRRLGYLCLQQQHVEVGDRLSVDAQELQFTSQSICQLSNLKLPGERAESRAALWEHIRRLRPCGSRQSPLGTTHGPSAWRDWDVPPWPHGPVTPSVTSRYILHPRDTAVWVAG